jgi:hypothetical protein
MFVLLGCLPSVDAGSVGETAWVAAHGDRFDFEKLKCQAGDSRFEWHRKNGEALLLKNDHVIFKTNDISLTFLSYDVSISSDGAFIGVFLRLVHSKTRLPTSVVRLVIIDSDGSIVEKHDFNGGGFENSKGMTMRLDRIYGISDDGLSVLIKVVEWTQSKSHVREYERLKVWSKASGLKNFDLGFLGKKDHLPGK